MPCCSTSSGRIETPSITTPPGQLPASCNACRGAAVNAQGTSLRGTQQCRPPAGQRGCRWQAQRRPHLCECPLLKHCRLASNHIERPVTAQLVHLPRRQHHFEIALHQRRGGRVRSRGERPLPPSSPVTGDPLAQCTRAPRQVTAVLRFPGWTNCIPACRAPSLLTPTSANELCSGTRAMESRRPESWGDAGAVTRLRSSSRQAGRCCAINRQVWALSLILVSIMRSMCGRSIGCASHCNEKESAVL